MKYVTSGVCSKEISFEIKDNKIKNISFLGGCNGNLQGLASLAEGRDVDEVIEKLKNIKCGHKLTSCPDQLSKALEEYKSTK
ncbi:hypothetical protein CLPU_1c01120 [Gottschalkia purinilytica]|uniref:ribonucleoside-diphosphate reductase n=1 Tax=Gottschalkia purinilytica TaxID=1503 RepID=A0A0L0WEN9_GOTPU|nr:TIGR03905 family TSCPD domain-containing protein [Gottschalkia purinilytica]KNF09947.1 hypothetical protein CLPU_1c01120 [Gottschalkia purinilytica]